MLAARSKKVGVPGEGGPGLFGAYDDSEALRGNPAYVYVDLPLGDRVTWIRRRKGVCDPRETALLPAKDGARHDDDPESRSLIDSSIRSCRVTIPTHRCLWLKITMCRIASDRNSRYAFRTCSARASLELSELPPARAQDTVFMRLLRTDADSCNVYLQQDWTRKSVGYVAWYQRQWQAKGAPALRLAGPSTYGEVLMYGRMSTCNPSNIR